MNLTQFAPDTLLRKARRYTRKLWVRVFAMGFLAFVVLGLTQIIENFVPEKLGSTLTGQAADELLDIIADAMLVVTTFSLSVMVMLYRSTSTQWTPRVHRMIIQDPVTQNTIAAFIGAYVYALTAIILRELGIYTDERALVLFVTTVLVLAFIVWNLIRWTFHLQTFGSLIDITRQLEETTMAQFRERLDIPCLGGKPWHGTPPEAARPIATARSGYVQQIYPEALQEVAARHGLAVYVSKVTGSYVFENQPMMYVVPEGEPEDDAQDENMEDALRKCVDVGHLRTYEQDPRFGLIVMGEIASKALSPGINDPGTAIDVITRVSRILSLYRDETEGDEAPTYPRVHIKPIDPEDLMADGFGALGRDGAKLVEVQIRLQRTCAALMKHPDDGLCRAAKEHAVMQYRRAMEALEFEPDRAALRAATAEEVRDAARD
ncbi:DUF2254 domain-containing protein [Sulfitobacter sp. D35]|uniref:DUF2254 domain-containing protein n=1 Tax=Sulfitobacter sp. D35 TaxID=3083252 RepID=UPI00296FF291|nr:DUF2254 domain-containing protein [Sulfitobacter sp. D35]MDW4497710.1 DUF2254 domain-containing protein [Sulfitobacter sp. D35]